MPRTPILLAALLIFSLPAAAQVTDNDAAMQRMERLERDIQLLQRQLALGGSTPAPSAPVSEDEVNASGGAAQLDVRLSKMDEEMRSLRGRVEEAEFQNRRLQENFEKFQRDTEFRFNELRPGGAPAPAAAAETTPAPAPAAAEAERKPINGAAETPGAPPAPAETTAGSGVLNPPAEAATNDNFATPRDHYNYAFRLLNQTKYEEAAKAFDSFTRQYPKDPLIGNAYYWQGETYYIRRDYVSAADNFRQGFEALPAGPKAADNLLKLAMSLSALDREKEACVVLGQVIAKFKKSSASIAEKAATEQKRMACQ